jgi:hypothetical protein
MRPSLSIVFANAEVTVDVPTAGPALPPDEARRWLDDQFVANDCEPLRASGKLLTVDKLLAIASAVGPAGFERDASFRLDFARAALSALARPMVRVDVEARAVTY